MDRPIHWYKSRCKGAVVNTTVAIATAKVLMKRYPNLMKEGLIIGTTLARSLLKRMNFVRRMKTTGKVRIPIGAQNEVELKFLHTTILLSIKHRRSVQVSNMTMERRNENNVPIAGVTDKRCITATDGAD